MKPSPIYNLCGNSLHIAESWVLTLTWENPLSPDRASLSNPGLQDDGGVSAPSGWQMDTWQGEVICVHPPPCPDDLLLLLVLWKFLQAWSWRCRKIYSFNTIYLEPALC